VGKAHSEERRTRIIERTGEWRQDNNLRKEIKVRPVEPEDIAAKLASVDHSNPVLKLDELVVQLVVHNGWRQTI
jgi:hypothetical protein